MNVVHVSKWKEAVPNNVYSIHLPGTKIRFRRFKPPLARHVLLRESTSFFSKRGSIFLGIRLFSSFTSGQSDGSNFVKSRTHLFLSSSRDHHHVPCGHRRHHLKTSLSLWHHQNSSGKKTLPLLFFLPRRDSKKPT